MKFPLTTHWYNKILSGEKTHEYRVHNKYWTVRVNNLEIGDVITFSKGYSKTRLIRIVTGIQYMSLGRLKNTDEEVYEFMKDKGYSFWQINFKE